MVAVLCVFLRVLAVLRLIAGSLASHLSLKTHCFRLIAQKLKSYTTINMEQNLEHHPEHKEKPAVSTS
jgi:hypothetical protein